MTDLLQCVQREQDKWKPWSSLLGREVCEVEQKLEDGIGS
jgi:hypothetical protein